MANSSVYFSKITSRKVKREVLWAMCFKEKGRKSVYLGNSLILGRNKTKEFETRNSTFIQSAEHAIPIYYMSTFRIPLGVCENLDKLVKRFW